MSVIIPSSPDDRRAIKGAVNELVNSLIRIDGERDQIKSIKEDIKDKYGIPPAMLGKMAAVHKQQKFTEVSESNDEFETMYETILATKDA